MNKHLQTQDESTQDALLMLEMMIFIDECKNNDVEHLINEGFGDEAKKWFDKIKGLMTKQVKPIVKKSGIHIDTSKKGLLQYAAGAGKGTYQLLYHAVNAYYNNNNASKIKVKELMNSINKEDLIDILLKLDTLTMHWVSGPLHMMDALTGTHIWANIQDKVQDTSKKATSAIQALEKLKNNLEGKMKQQLTNYANGLRRIFDIGGFGKVSEETTTPDIAEPDVKIGAMARRLKRRPCKRRRRRSVDKGDGVDCNYEDSDQG